jgi:hypothetical protein
MSTPEAPPPGIGDLVWYNDFYDDPGPPPVTVDVVRPAMVTGWKDQLQNWPWLRVFTEEGDIKVVYAAKGSRGVRQTWFDRPVAPPTPGPPPDDSVSTQKIQNKAVTVGKLADAVVAQLVPTGKVAVTPQNKIDDLAAAPTKEDINGILAALRSAGLLKTT